ncbi:MAG: hypothetical protein R6U37_01765 [Dehalococcoidia bacterium]
MKATLSKSEFVLVVSGLLLVVVVLLIYMMTISGSPEDSGKEREAIDSIIDSVLRAPEDVQEDLIEQGLATRNKDEKGNIVGGEIVFGKIRDLIELGIYHINEEGELQFGPNHKDAIRRN